MQQADSWHTSNWLQGFEHRSHRGRLPSAKRRFRVECVHTVLMDRDRRHWNWASNGWSISINLFHRPACLLEEKKRVLSGDW